MPTLLEVLQGENGDLVETEPTATAAGRRQRVLGFSRTIGRTSKVQIDGFTRRSRSKGVRGRGNSAPVPRWGTWHRVRSSSMGQPVQVLPRQHAAARVCHPIVTTSPTETPRVPEYKLIASSPGICAYARGCRAFHSSGAPSHLGQISEQILGIDGYHDWGVELYPKGLHLQTP
jgi:hypothetical protein